MLPVVVMGDDGKPDHSSHHGIVEIALENEIRVCLVAFVELILPVLP